MGCVVQDGNLFFVDDASQTIRKINLATNIITTVFGSGQTGYYGDGIVMGSGALTPLKSPRRVFLDSERRIVIADTGNNFIRRVDPKTGIITKIAGGVVSGAYSGDGGSAIDAGLSDPYGAAYDSYGNLFIVDNRNFVVRKVDNVTQNITTIAGIPQSWPYIDSGDGGLASSAKMHFPIDVAVGPNGDIYILEQDGSVVRKIDPSTQIISTFAGKPGIQTYTGDDGPATSATLRGPAGLCIDSVGNVIIADRGNDAVRRVDIQTGFITTIAGGSYGFAGDGGDAKSAKMSGPFGCAVDRFDNIYVAETGNNIIRFIENTTKKIYTIAGVPLFSGYVGDLSDPSKAAFNFPSGVSVDEYGSVYVADTQNNVIRKITFNCSDLFSNDPLVCGGHGLCSYRGCICDEGYTFNGTSCVIMCNSLLIDNPKVCSGHGSCLGNDVCTSGYGGSNCEYPLCFGILASDPKACSGYTCSGIDTCDCPSYRYGANCSQFVEYVNYTSTVIAQNNPDRTKMDMCDAINCVISTVDFIISDSEIIVSDLYNYRIWKVKDGKAYKFIGDGVMPTSFSNKIDTLRVQTTSIGYSNTGELYLTLTIPVSSKSFIVKVTNQGNVEIVLGSFAPQQECGDNVLATSCTIQSVANFAFDSSDGLYVTRDSGTCVKKINLSTGYIYHIAGDCMNGGSAVGTFAQTKFKSITQLLYRNDILYVVDRTSNAIRALNVTSKTTSTLVDSTKTTSPVRFDFDSSEGVYIVGADTLKVKYYDFVHPVVTYAGTGMGGYLDNPPDGTAEEILIDGLTGFPVRRIRQM